MKKPSPALDSIGDLLPAESIAFCRGVEWWRPIPSLSHICYGRASGMRFGGIRETDAALRFRFVALLEDQAAASASASSAGTPSADHF